MFKRLFKWKFGLIPLLAIIFLVVATMAGAGTAKKFFYGLKLKTMSAPSTPESGYGHLYITDQTIYFKADNATVTDLISGAGTAVDFALTADADAGDKDIKSIDELEFYDSGLVIDGGGDGVLLISSDGTLEIATADWDISTTGTITGASMSADQISAGALGIGANALTIGNSYLEIGSDPADGGTIRLPNAGSILFEKAVTGVDINALEVDSGDLIQIGKTGASGVTITPAVTLGGALTIGGTLTVAANAISGTTGTVTYSNWSVAADGDAAFVDLTLTGNMAITGSFKQDALVATGPGATNITLDGVGTGEVRIANTSTGIILLGGNSAGATLVTVGDGTNLLLGEGSLTIDNDVDEDALIITSSATTESAIEITSAATTTGDTISVTADALLSGGKMLYLESGSIPSGAYYIYAYDGSGNPNFSVGQYGTTTIEGNSTSDVLNLTAGDLQIDDGIFEVNTNEDVMSYIERAQASVSKHVMSIVEQTDTVASAKAVLFLDQDTDSTPSSALEIDTEGAYAIKIDALVAAGDMMLIDVADTYVGQGIIADLGPWTGTTGEGFIDIWSDTGGSVQEVGQAIRVDLGGAGIAGTAVDGKALYAHSQAAVKSTESLVYLDTLFNSALHIENEGVTADGIVIEVPDAHTGQSIIIDLGQWPGTVTEGAINIESDSHATAQLGQAIRINLQNTTLDTAAISGKGLYMADASAYKASSYLLHVASANCGAAWFDGEVDFKLDTNEDDIVVTANAEGASGYAAGHGVLTIYDDSTGQDNTNYLFRGAREAVADANNGFLLFEDASTGGAGNGTDQFIIAYDGATTITGTSSGTDALTLTAGDILVTAGNIDITTGNLLTANGNAGIGLGGVPLEAWRSTATAVSALQLGGAAFWAAIKTQAAGDSSYLGHNAYFDETNNQWEAMSTVADDEAVMLEMSDGTWQFNVEDTALGDDVQVVWIPALHISKTGLVGIGTIIPSDLLEVQAAPGSPGTITISTAETTNTDGDEIGRIDFQAPLDTAGTDAILVGASIWAEADDTFTSSVNSTELVFATASTDTAAEVMRIDKAGNLGIGSSTPDRLLHAEIADAVTNTVTYVQRLSHVSSATPVANFGTGIEFELEDNDETNFRVAAIIETIWTDAGDTTSCDADVIIKTMLADGAAAEGFRVTSDKDIVIQATKKIYLDGEGDTYIDESAADVIDFNVGGNTKALTITESANAASIRIQEQVAGFTITTDTVISSIEMYGDDDTSAADHVAGQIEVIGTGAWIDGAEDAKMVLNVADNGTLNADQLVLETDGTVTITNAAKIGTVEFHSVTHILTAAEVNGLMGAPHELVPTYGANTWIEFVSATLSYKYITTAFTVGGDEDFVIEWADGTDATAAIETTGFLDQAADKVRWTLMVLTANADFNGMINQGLRLDNAGTGETADGGTSVLNVTVVYRVHATLL